MGHRNIDDTTRAVREALGKRSEPVSRLGYFCAPFRPAQGPLRDCVIKTYRGGRDMEFLDRLARHHDTYVSCLTQAGVRLPDTQFLILNHTDYAQPVIVQTALPQQHLLRPQLETADIETAVALLDQVANTIAAFWAAVAQHPGRIGYHPSIRNFALDENGPVFFDTFPPLIGYTRREMGDLLLRFSESWLIRLVGPMVPERIRAIQDEWYSPAGTIIGLVGSAIRLRPQNTRAIMAWAHEFADTRLRGAMRTAVLNELSAPPRLSPIWTATRRILRLEGRPNV